MIERVVIIPREIDEELANQVTAELLLLSAEDQREPITLYVNSPGGSVADGLAIVDTMATIPNQVRTFAMGLAAGIALLVLASGTRGHRHALAHARMRLTRIKGDAEASRHWRFELARMFATHTGKPAEAVFADMQAQRWFDAPQARAYGLVDRITARASSSHLDVEPAVSQLLSLAALINPWHTPSAESLDVDRTWTAPALAEELCEQLHAHEPAVFAQALAIAVERGDARAVLSSALRLGRPDSLEQLKDLMAAFE